MTTSLFLVRKKKNISICEVSKELKIPVGTLRAYERGRNPSDARKKLLANYYGVTVQELFFDE